jgi:hypothetical protein
VHAEYASAAESVGLFENVGRWMSPLSDVLCGTQSISKLIKNRLCELTGLVDTSSAPGQEPFKPDDHSELVPLLPIPNRTVKRLSADDSADSRVKVGHRQATYEITGFLLMQESGFFRFELPHSLVGMCHVRVESLG